jgi:PAS domain-containing protein
MADAASVAAMIEGIGSRSNRWVQIKREDFLIKEEERTGHKRMPKNIMQKSSRFQHAVSSLSSSSNSSNNGSSGDDSKSKKRSHNTALGSGEYHDYHAKPLPDPKLVDQDRNSNSSNSGEDDSPEDSNSGDDAKQISNTDTSSGDDSNAAIKERGHKRRKMEEQAKPVSAGAAAAATEAKNNLLPSNIAKKGGIAHNVMPVMNSVVPKNGNARLTLAPAVPLPPFAGLGKQSHVPTVGTAAAVGSASMPASNSLSTLPMHGDKNTSVDPMRMQGPAAVDGNLLAHSGHAMGPAVISGDFETSSSSSSRSKLQIRGYYHVNEDDMILMEDVIMCPFVFRTQDAVLCGALSECVMPGMLRGHFSSTNKLLSMEMIYDAMGFMQQLERASGSELMAQIIPGSLEMALSPGSTECRVITLAEPPFRIVNVNEAWTKLTKYTQMEVEGSELFDLLEPPETADQPSSNPLSDLNEVLEGRCKCTTRFHSDKDGREFVDFISSYPLTNASDEITHILHVSKELVDAVDENQESSATTEEMNDANP